MNLFYFIVVLVIILVIFYLFKSKEGFNYDLAYTYETVDYNTRKQKCNELTFNPNPCTVETVIPSDQYVCNESLTPIDNNNKECRRPNKEKKNKNLSLEYNFDLLPSFNNAQQYDLKTDVRSLNSLENDLISNY